MDRAIVLLGAIEQKGKRPDFPLPSSPIRAKLTSRLPWELLLLRIISKLRFVIADCTVLLMSVIVARDKTTIISGQRSPIQSPQKIHVSEQFDEIRFVNLARTFKDEYVRSVLADQNDDINVSLLRTKAKTDDARRAKQDRDWGMNVYLCAVSSRRIHL